MIPSVVSSQLRDTVAEYLRTTFSLRDAAYEQALLEFLEDPEHGLFRGPYLDVRLPFRRAAEGERAPLFVRPGFTPYAHQLRAWERLSSAEGRRPRSTIVATGTGSGKTECFLFPLLDHCLRHASAGSQSSQSSPSIKAIILYPMNALASDQAGRLAELIHNWTPPGGDAAALRGKVTAGLYVGGEGSHSRPTDKQLVDMRDRLREQPPDILLTNYRMLDFLLMRPEDAALWRNNGTRTLQYLVLDELHTYDGAQGTDVAFLIRRLRQRLRVEPGHLCCVGTSATIGGRGEAGRQALLRFASEVFAQSFDEDAIVGEDRLTIRETFPVLADPESPEVEPEQVELLDPERYEGPLEYLRAQAQLWLGAAPSDAGWLPSGLDDDAGRLALGEALDRHRFLRDLLQAQARLGGAGPQQWTSIIDQLPQDSALHELGQHSDAQWRALSSFVSLISIARRRVEGRVGPYLTVQVQLWMRELRRLLRRVPERLDEPLRFAWHDDGQIEPDRKYAVQAYCRECGVDGFAMVHVEGRDELDESPGKVGKAFMDGETSARFVIPGEAPVDEGQVDMFATRYLCPISLHLSDSNTPFKHRYDTNGEWRPVPRIPVTVYGEDRELERPRFTGRCPRCQADDGVTILGSRAASLSSVIIGHLFQSPFNGDPKLLAFTDSVQDASHRAGFFAGRTFRFTLRTAIQTVVQAEPHAEPHAETDAEPLTLASLGERVVAYWQAALEPRASERGRAAATLLPPDLRDDPAYAELMAAVEAGKAPSAKLRGALDKLLRQRIGWEVTREFGLGVVVGRSLEKTGCAVAHADPELLDQVAVTLAGWINEQRPLQRKGDPVTTAQVRHYLVGLTERMRTRGAVHNELLGPYVRHGTSYWLSRRRAPRLSRFGPRSVLPRFVFHGATHRIFEPIAAPPRRVTWYRDWTARALAAEARDEGITRVVLRALELLGSAGIVESKETAGGGTTRGSQALASGLRPTAVLVSRFVARIGCSSCGATRTVAEAQREAWLGARCTTFRCRGVWEPLDQQHRSARRHRYYRRVYTSGRVRRVFAEEHTGLLQRQDREALERSFKEGSTPDAPNLLACTPTLEMGIDIGDLSAVMLCTVPPLPANFIQRVGRAGRSTGNALVITVANERPHDRYFFEQPEQMMRGDVEPPACFLDAPDMLKRQLVAHALDYWAARTKETKIPRDMRTLLGPANAEGFPNSFYRFYADNKYVIAGEFLNAFGRDEREHPGWVDIKRMINDLIHKDHVITAMRDAFEKVAQERKTINRRRKALLDRKAALVADPSLATPHPEDPRNAAELELEDIEEAIRGYGRQSRALSEKYPPNVLTDEGVLPNYAFPEPGVTLRATFRASRDDAEAHQQGAGDKPGKRDKPVKAEYQRPASAALREFAPFNSFYAEGRKIRINQIDLGTKNDPTIEHWRLCPECHHAEREDPGQQPADHCPACEASEWRDAGQQRQLIAFVRAWSSSTLSEASTSDDSDDRERESYATHELIEREPTHDAPQARLIDEGEVLFGYELWPRARLREINFGRQRDVDVSRRVAGHSIAQRGFAVCRSCGRVQEPGQHGSLHTPWCRSKTAGEAEQFEHVCLYREMTSEAIRVLLPVANHEVPTVRFSFAAALELGFRKKFGGQPSHLRVTTMSEPARDGRKQFLVIYDTVPGGTGYLAELWRGDELFEVMQRALQAMRECSCTRNPDRDGCYRCVYAHQHQRDLASISRRRAVELFELILAKRDKIDRVASLSEVSQDSLLESELERRFVNALREHAERRGWLWSELVHRGAVAWRVQVHEGLIWELYPQVALASSDGVAHWSRPDFVLVAKGRPELRKVAVFTDGFGFHVQPERTRSRIEDDIRKRAAILGVSDATPTHDRHWVWSLTYNDVAAALGEAPALVEQARLLSLQGGRGRMFANAAKNWPGSKDSGDPELLATGSFELLTRWLEQPDEQAWRKNVISGLIAGFDLPKFRALAVRNEIDALREQAKLALPSELVSPVVSDGVVSAALRRNAHAVLAWQLPVAELKAGRMAAVEAVLRLDDAQAARLSDDFEPAWRGFLQAWNLLQFHEGGATVCSTERLGAGEDVEAPAVQPLVREVEADAAPLSSAYVELLHEFGEGEALWRALHEAKVPAPEEIDALSDDELDGIEDAHLVWPQQRVALQAGADEHDLARARRYGWTLFDTDSVAPEAVLAALRSGG